MRSNAVSEEAQTLAVKLVETMRGESHGDKFDALTACLYALGVPPITDKKWWATQSIGADE
jgi:hypothetical protein